MSDDGVISIKSRLLKMFAELDEGELDTIEHWLSSQSYKKELEKMKSFMKSEKYLIKLGNSIKKITPLGAEMPSENIVMPSVGDQADCTENNTCHIDEFLYDDDEVEKLVKAGKFQRHYCNDCQSKNIQDLIFISHSMSRQALQYMFKVLLPNDLDDKQILDVGSRIGAVIFAAYHFTNASTIIGIEMNKECCDLQENILGQFSMDANRIKVVHSDVMDRSDIVERSDIIIINVLDFFVDNEKHKQMWYYFKNHIKKGSYLVTNRSMPETLGGLEIYEEFMTWLSICKPCQLDNEILFDIDDFDYSIIHLYIVN